MMKQQPAMASILSDTGFQYGQVKAKSIEAKPENSFFKTLQKRPNKTQNALRNFTKYYLLLIKPSVLYAILMCIQTKINMTSEDICHAILWL